MRVIKTPKSVDLDITTRCNLRCKHCSHFSSAGDVDNDLPTEEWLNFFKELNRYTVTSVTLCGGEPFCREDIKELINGIVRNRMRFKILSNGTLITDEMASFLASTGRCDFVQISIDGSIPSTHDALRGDGNFEKAIYGLKALQKYKIPLQVRVTIFKKNVSELESIAKLLLEDIGLYSFSTNSAGNMGLCTKNAELIQLTAEERSHAMEILLRLNKKYDGRIIANAGPLAEAKFWPEMEKARREGKKSIPGRGYLAGCNCMFNQLAVRADGVIVPCILLSHIELGQINKDDLKEIWHNHPEILKLRKRENIPLNEFDFCKGCQYTTYCRGGCPATAYTINNSIYHPSADSCLKRFIEEGGRLPDKELLNSEVLGGV